MSKIVALLYRTYRGSVWNISGRSVCVSQIRSPVTGNTDYKRGGAGKEEEESWKKRILLRLGIIFGLGYFTFVNRRKIIPNVEASTRRFQYNFIADVVEKTAAAVVNIEIKDKQRVDFFSGSLIPRSNGSGFIISEDGLILTNAHVVMGREAGVVSVKLHDGSTYTGVVEDIDMKGDLATVRINSQRKLPILQMGNSSDIRPGEWVVAMGSPLSLSNTVTTGVVSTVQRKSSELKIFGKEMDYIQTDAAITFGNSGGPLVNLDGQVIGINSMKVTAGISFAIPIDYAKEFLKRNEDRKKGILPKWPTNPRRYMGITMLSLTPTIIAEMRARNKPIPAELTSGVLVWKIVLSSPAHMAGLMPGDILVELNGEKVVGAATVYKALETSTVLVMKIFRNGHIYTFRVEPEIS